MKEHVSISACDWCRHIEAAVARVRVEVCKEHLAAARKLHRHSGSAEDDELVVEPIEPERRLREHVAHRHTPGRYPTLGPKQKDAFYWKDAMERILTALRNAGEEQTGVQLSAATKLKYSTLCRALRHLTKEERVITTGHARARRYELRYPDVQVPQSAPPKKGWTRRAQKPATLPAPPKKHQPRLNVPANPEQNYWPGVEAKVLKALGEIGDMTTKPIVATRTGLTLSTTYSTLMRLVKKGQVRMTGPVGRYRRYLLAQPLPKRKAS